MATNNLSDTQQFQQLINIERELSEINSHVAGAIALLETADVDSDGSIGSAMVLLRVVSSRLTALEGGLLQPKKGSSHEAA